MGRPAFMRVQLPPLSVLLNRPALPPAYTVLGVCGSIARAMIGTAEPLTTGPFVVHWLRPADAVPDTRRPRATPTASLITTRPKTRRPITRSRGATPAQKRPHATNCASPPFIGDSRPFVRVTHARHRAEHRFHRLMR